MLGKEIQVRDSTAKSNAEPMLPLPSSPPQTHRVVPPIAQQAALRLDVGMGGSFAHVALRGSKASTVFNGIMPELPPHTYKLFRSTPAAAHLRGSNMGGENVQVLISGSKCSAVLRYV
jgi:hypothetical protein